jgi:peptidylprolyl isomerase
LRAVKALMLTIALCLALAVAGCGGDDDTTTTEATDSAATTTESSGSSESSASPEGQKPTITVPAGAPPNELEIKDLRVGSGPEAKAGDEVTVQYVGVGYDSEEEFDASWGGEPFTFQLGAGLVIEGWDQGVEGMKVGGQRELIIPSGLAYGPEGSPPAIGPNETLIFVVDLVAVK